MGWSALNYSHSIHSELMYEQFVTFSINWTSSDSDKADLRPIIANVKAKQFLDSVSLYFLYFIDVPFWTVCGYRSKFAQQSVSMHTSRYVLKWWDIDTWVGYLTRFHNILLAQAHTPPFVLTIQKVAVLETVYPQNSWSSPSSLVSHSPLMFFVRNSSCSAEEQHRWRVKLMSPSTY